MAKAEAADTADIPDGMSIPDELALREKRLQKLAEAREVGGAGAGRSLFGVKPQSHAPYFPHLWARSGNVRTALAAAWFLSVAPSRRTFVAASTSCATFAVTGALRGVVVRPSCFGYRLPALAVAPGPTKT